MNIIEFELTVMDMIYKKILKMLMSYEIFQINCINRLKWLLKTMH